MSKRKDSRRKLLKSIAAGSGAVVVGKSLPETWSKPVINSVVLPAHAETTDDTGSLPAGTIICSSLTVRDGSQCQSGQISFYVSGEVSASDGSSLTGASLTVTYANGERSGPGPGPTTTPMPTTSPPDVTVTFTVLVGANNTFASGELVATPPNGGGWSDPEATISVRFTDPAYGTSTCSTLYSCSERE